MCTLNVEGVHLFKVGCNVALRQLLNGYAHLGGPRYHLVVYVGEVLHVLDLESPVLQVATQDIEDDGSHRMPNVGGCVRRDAANVHLYCPVRGRQFSFLFGKRIVQVHDSGSMEATLKQAMPWLLPVKPRPSVVVAFTLTIAGSTPKEAAMDCLIAWK